jgi:hypothetical protein
MPAYPDPILSTAPVPASDTTDNPMAVATCAHLQ